MTKTNENYEHMGQLPNHIQQLAKTTTETTTAVINHWSHRSNHTAAMNEQIGRSTTRSAAWTTSGIPTSNNGWYRKSQQHSAVGVGSCCLFNFTSTTGQWTTSNHEQSWLMTMVVLEIGEQWTFSHCFVQYELTYYQSLWASNSH